MDRKHGKYVVNVECSENQSPITCSDDQEAHSSACWHRPSNDTTSHVSSNLTGLYVSPGVLVHSRCPHIELSNAQVKGNCCNNWSLWEVFLACLLASVITTAIGVLIICLVNNRGSDNSPITSQLPSNNDIPTMTSTTTKPAVTTTSTEPTTITTSTESTTTAMSTEPTTSTAPTTTTTGPTTLTDLTVTTAESTTLAGATVATTGSTASTGATTTATGSAASTGVTNTST
ncbi:dynactin-associated protein-like [Mustela nigripes]|uniref:dynactin-associated protein-like n=1 Tax=Mustela nigripes TaxID=77151 RepID=UPI0028154AB3|nr:dynactin-associated protein-like [Mustela nigripes]